MDNNEKLEQLTPSQILPGMYVYADGLIYPEIIPGRQIKAVVGYVDGSEVLAVCLHMNVLPLFCSIECKKTASQWCSNYVEDGVKQGEAFIPSLEQLEKLYKFREAIETAFKALELPSAFGSSTWSSTDKDYAHAWGVNFINGERYTWDKRGYGYVCPVIKIVL